MGYMSACSGPYGFFFAMALKRTQPEGMEFLSHYQHENEMNLN